MTTKQTLLIGGARSGKSARAQALAQAWAAAMPGREVWLVATAQAGDAEMAERIALHRAQRPAGWQVVEEPLALARVLRQIDAPHRLLLIDCLTLWLCNLLLQDAPPASADALFVPGPHFEPERAALLATLPQLQAERVLVGNEVGHGIVPLGALNRRFVDESGRLHQALGAQSQRVRWVMAGCELALKG